MGYMQSDAIRLFCRPGNELDQTCPDQGNTSDRDAELKPKCLQ